MFVTNLYRGFGKIENEERQSGSFLFHNVEGKRSRILVGSINFCYTRSKKKKKPNNYWEIYPKMLMAETILLPTKLVEDVLSLKESTTPILYEIVCRIVCELDDADLLNDQICLSCDAEGACCLEWPYGLYFDLEMENLQPLYRIHHPSTKTIVRVLNYEAAMKTLCSILEMVVNKEDIHDEYRKEKRGCILLRGAPF